jgi:uncharacterized membrane protein YfcA
MAILASAAVGLAGGVLSGLFGLGGGIVLVPLLGLILGLNQHQAQGAALAALLLPNGLPAVLHLRRRGIRIRWALAVQLATGFLPAAWAGARAAALLPDRPLRGVFAGILAVLAWHTFRQEDPEGPRDSRDAPEGGTLAWGLAIGAAGGVASGLLGIGGGILIIPLLTWALPLTQHEAQAASLTMMLGPIGLPAVAVYSRGADGLPWTVLLGVALGFMMGAYGGARAVSRLRAGGLRRAFALLLLAMAGILLGRG